MQILMKAAGMDGGRIKQDTGNAAGRYGFMRMKKTVVVLCICLSLVTWVPGNGRSEPEADSGSVHRVTTDMERTEDHEAITWDLIQMTEHDPELKALLEKSIAQAYAMNPDPDTNPVSDLESYYAFLDRCYLGLPWEIHPSGKYSSLYDQIDQGMGCLYHCRCERTC